jgi:hypothetical protein
MAKQVKLSNGRDWRTQSAALAHFKEMLHRYSNGNVVDTVDDHDDLIALLERYDACIEGGPTKIGAGIDHFERRLNWVEGHSTPGFWVVRVDGTATDFSYISAVKGEPRSLLADFNDACREAVREDLLDAKTEHFRQHADAGGRVKCELSGELITKDEAHIDHAYPGFGHLAHSFRAARGWMPDIPLGIVSEPADGQIHATFVDPTVKDAFRAFHHAAAKTRIVKGRENLARAAANRVPKIARPVKIRMR